MKMKMSVHGAGDIVARFRNLAEKVPENARKTMHRSADRVVVEAKLNAPVDDHELEDSIRKEIGYSAKRRLQVDIVVGGIVRGVDVSRYAAEIHENYESKNPGPNTLAKRAAHPGRYIGSKFLARAVNAERARLRADMIRVIVQTIREEEL